MTIKKGARGGGGKVSRGCERNQGQVPNQPPISITNAYKGKEQESLIMADRLSNDLPILHGRFETPREGVGGPAARLAQREQAVEEEKELGGGSAAGTYIILFTNYRSVCTRRTAEGLPPISIRA